MDGDIIRPLHDGEIVKGKGTYITTDSTDYKRYYILNDLIVNHKYIDHLFLQIHGNEQYFQKGDIVTFEGEVFKYKKKDGTFDYNIKTTSINIKLKGSKEVNDTVRDYLNTNSVLRIERTLYNNTDKDKKYYCSCCNTSFKLRQSLIDDAINHIENIEEYLVKPTKIPDIEEIFEKLEQIENKIVNQKISLFNYFHP